MGQKCLNRILADGMKEALEGRPRRCEIVKSNIVTPAPPYPYLSFTVTEPRKTRGTPGRLTSGVYAEHITQTWSFTVQSDDDNEALDAASAVQRWLRVSGRIYLSDNDVAVVRVGGIQCRDNLISVEYEHRYGFDATFSLSEVFCFKEPVIETAEFKIEEGSE